MNDRQRHDALRSLLSSGGWMVLGEAMAARREGLLARLVARETGDDGRREAAAEVRMIDALLGWPEREVMTLAARMERKEAARV